MEEEEGKLPSQIIGVRGMNGFAYIYEQFPEEISKVKDACLVQYCEDQEFDAREYSAFKMGVATVLKFFIACQAESVSIAKQKAYDEAMKKRDGSLKK